MQKQDISSVDRKMKWALLVVSLITLVALAFSALRENVFTDWRSYRTRYAQILREKATDAHSETIAHQFEVRIVQQYLPVLNTVDRCTTCHAGVDDPRMTDQPQPFTTHPGRYLQIHPPEQFGCTVCHQGQGRATETDEAHGHTPHWDTPMLAHEHTKTTCAKCHDEIDLYGEPNLLTKADDHQEQDGSAKLLRLGKHLTETQGCLGCHLFRGKGGLLGPDITFEGDKKRHDFVFSSFEKHEPLTVVAWHRKHFKNPAHISPGSQMPPITEEKKIEALTAYMLSLKQKSVPKSYYLPSKLNPQPLSGKQLYGMYCASCHGQEGKGSEVPLISSPSLNNYDSISIANDDYYRFIIANGRSGSHMPAWKEGVGNLARDEIDRIVHYIRSWDVGRAVLGDINSLSGKVEKGKSYYQGLCANCHGRTGEGGIGNTLHSLSFLSIATDSFLAQTIVHGRPGTAMPSWKHLPTHAVNDLLAYIRHWQPVDSKDAGKIVPLQRVEEMDPRLVRAGQQLYQGNCAGCHGRSGEGGIGLKLNSPDILRAVDDAFLYQTLMEGRPSTAMPSWRHFKPNQIQAIIAYLRTWQKGKPYQLDDPHLTGDYALGEIHYKVSCLRCHGEDARGSIGPQLANPVFLNSVSNATLNYWISHGRAGTAMKGFLAEEHGPTTLKPDHIADVIAYLRHLGSRQERPILRMGLGNPAVGEHLFKGSCSSCHGLEGEGASGPQLNNPTFLQTASNGFLEATVVLGRTGTPMRSMIHGQEGLGQVSPEQIQDIIAYMRLWDFSQDWRKPRAIAEMSQRAISSGQQKFTRYCSGCHGPNGRGQLDGQEYFAPGLNNPEFLESVPDGFLLATIARGRSRTQMRPFGIGAGGIVSLDENAISDIISYIRTWQERSIAKGD